METGLKDAWDPGVGRMTRVRGSGVGHAQIRRDGVYRRQIFVADEGNFFAIRVMV